MDTGYQQMEDQRLADIEKKYIQLQSDLRKIVVEMREDEMKANTTQALQGYHEASGDWADRLEQLLKREGK